MAGTPDFDVGLFAACCACARNRAGGPGDTGIARNRAAGRVRHIPAARTGAFSAGGSMWESGRVSLSYKHRRLLALAIVAVAMAFALPRFLTHTPYQRLG